MDKKCPCINCITLAICKARMIGHSGIYRILSPKCSLIKHYCDDDDNYCNFRSIERTTLLKIFNQKLGKDSN